MIDGIPVTATEWAAIIDRWFSAASYTDRERAWNELSAAYRRWVDAGRPSVELSVKVEEAYSPDPPYFGDSYYSHSIARVVVIDAVDGDGTRLRIVAQNANIEVRSDTSA